jgi:hypothetical protein
MHAHAHTHTSKYAFNGSYRMNNQPYLYCMLQENQSVLDPRLAVHFMKIFERTGLVIEGIESTSMSKTLKHLNSISNY